MGTFEGFAEEDLKLPSVVLENGIQAGANCSRLSCNKPHGCPGGGGFGWFGGGASVLAAALLMVAVCKDRLAGTLAPPREFSILTTLRLGDLAVGSAFLLYGYGLTTR